MDQVGDVGAIFGLVRGFGSKHGLSVRETEVLFRLVDGDCRKQAATALGCSAGTVDTYWRRILAKSGADSLERFLANLIRYFISELLTASPAPRSSSRQLQTLLGDRPGLYDPWPRTESAPGSIGCSGGVEILKKLRRLVRQMCARQNKGEPVANRQT
jgi:DNA-binding CsgD family transcriptional regulator